MKQLYTLFIFLILAFASGGALAQNSTDNNAPLQPRAKEFAFSGDRLIDPRSDIKLFPNPAVEYLIVEINSEELSNVSFELNNIIGNAFQIRSEPMGDKHYKIYVKDLRPGYYFLTIKDQNSTYKRAYRFLKK